jgi:aryl-alcohol dehydrogenase-like predicted oxidoreductase
VGRAIGTSGIPRAEIFVTTKLATEDQGFQASQDALKASLERLGLEYVDLYLIHWPAGDAGKYVDSWGGLMKQKEVGSTKSIGVCNFTPDDLSNIIDLSYFVPAVNQIELHPLLNQAALRAVNAEHGIVTEAYGPLGVGKLLDNPTVTSIADPLEPAVGQRRDPAVVVARTDRHERRRVRVRAGDRAHGRAQRARRRHPVSSGPGDLHRHLGRRRPNHPRLVRHGPGNAHCR